MLRKIDSISLSEVLSNLVKLSFLVSSCQINLAFKFSCF
jgi:hypothetical protein